MLWVDIGERTKIEIRAVCVIGLELEMRVFILVSLFHYGVLEGIAFAQRAVAVHVIVHPLINWGSLLTDGFERRVGMKQRKSGGQAVIRDSEHSHFAIVVRHVFYEPFDAVVSIRRFIRGLGIIQIDLGRKFEYALGLEASAQVLDHENVAILGKLLQACGHLLRGFGGNAIGGPAKEDRQRPLLVGWRKDYGLETYSV